jgi:hypothetical protein
MSASKILNVAVRDDPNKFVIADGSKQVVGCGEVAVAVHVGVPNESRRHG